MWGFVFMGYRKVLKNILTTPTLITNQQVIQSANIIDRSIPLIKEHVQFDNVSILLTKMDQYHGIYDPIKSRVEIDYRLDGFNLISTLVHELIHCEQYQQSRLDSVLVEGGYVFTWEGGEIYIEDSQYDLGDWPWEREAYERGDGIALVVYSELEAFL